MHLKQQETRLDRSRRYCRTGSWLAILALLIPAKAGWTVGTPASTDVLGVPIRDQPANTRSTLVLEVDASEAVRDADRLVAEAYRHLSRQEFPEARDKARKASELQASNPASHALLGNALLWLGEMEAGQEEIDRAEALQHAASSGKELALVHIGRGTADWLKAKAPYSATEQNRSQSRQKGNAGTATKLSKEASKLDGEAVSPLQEAEQEFKKALQSQLDLSDVRDRLTALIAHNNLGAVFHLQGRMNEAEKSRKAYDSALRHFEAAEEEYQKAVELDRYHIAYFNLGNNCLAKGLVYEAIGPRSKAEEMWQQAVESLTTAVQLSCDDAGSQALLSAAYLRQNHIPEAVKWARRARDRGLTDHFIFAALKKKGVSL
jgi:tetratricopeptide (TPR) repeat protein